MTSGPCPYRSKRKDRTVSAHHVALTDRRIDAGNPIEQHDRRSWPLGSVPKVVVKTSPSGLHSLKFAPSERRRNLRLSYGREVVPSAGIARSSAADFRAIVEATASARSIHQVDREGKRHGPQQPLTRNDATRVRFVVGAGHVRAWHGGRERCPGPLTEGSNLDGDRCALCPVRGGRRAQDLREIRARDQLQAVRRRKRRSRRHPHRQFGYRCDHRARRALPLGQGRQALRDLVLVHQRASRSALPDATTSRSRKTSSAGRSPIRARPAGICTSCAT